MTHKGMEHCSDASVVTKGDGVAWVKCDTIVGDCFWIIEHGKCPKGKQPITLTPTLATHYQQRGQDTGKSVQQLVLADLTALIKKRVAREERRVWKEIEYERL